jgi:hypothetical protein
MYVRSWGQTLLAALCDVRPQVYVTGLDSWTVLESVARSPASGGCGCICWEPTGPANTLLEHALKTGVQLMLTQLRKLLGMFGVKHSLRKKDDMYRLLLDTVFSNLSTDERDTLLSKHTNKKTQEEIDEEVGEQVQEVWDVMDADLKDGFKEIEAAQKRRELRNRVTSARARASSAAAGPTVSQEQAALAEEGNQCLNKLMGSDASLVLHARC